MNFGAASGRFRRLRQSNRVSGSASERRDEQSLQEEDSQNRDTGRLDTSRDSRNMLIAVLQEALDIVADSEDLMEANATDARFYIRGPPHSKQQQ